VRSAEGEKGGARSWELGEINPKSEDPKSERNPKSEVRRAAALGTQTPQAGGKLIEDENEDENEEDSLARQGAVKPGQTWSNRNAPPNEDEDEDELLAPHGRSNLVKPEWPMPKA
jgi:hypothetical protein